MVRYLSSLVSTERYSDDGAYEAMKQRGNEAAGTSEQTQDAEERVDGQRRSQRRKKNPPQKEEEFDGSAGVM